MKSVIISEEEVKKIAGLARLTLTSREIQKFQKQLVKIIAYFQQLKELATSSIKITRTGGELVNISREDIANEERTFTQNQALMNAKKTYKGYFVVDKVIDKE